MSDKKGFMGLAALAAAGAGAAMLMKKTKEINEEETFHVKKTTENYRNTERENMTKTARGSIIPTATTKPLPARRSRRVWMTSMLTS